MEQYLGKQKPIDKRKKYNNYYIYGDIVFVKFSNCNEYFLCDLEDWEVLKGHCWSKNSLGYAASSYHGYPTLMHKIIMNCPEGKVVDHIYRVSTGILDNRKNNLRVCDQWENQCNHGLQTNNTSGHAGVHWNKRVGRWQSYIKHKGKRIHLGWYDDFDKAVEAREKAEIKYFGEFRSVI